MPDADSIRPSMALCLLVPLAGLFPPVSAQETAQNSTTVIQEIVVTATRREESIQAVPMSITAVSGAQLEDRAATDFFDYASSIPNLSFGYSGGGGAAGLSSARQVAIRGIQGDGTTGFYIDETPVPVSIDPKLLDITRIEVLRGPQGTLYGALSMGGTVRVLTEQPNSQEVQVRAHASLSDTENTSQPNFQVDGSLNVPLVENNLALRISGLHEEVGGYFKRYAEDTGTTQDNIGKSLADAAQIALLWQPTQDVSITPRYMYQRTLLDGLPLALVPYNAASLTPIVVKPTSLTIVEPFNVAEASYDDWSLLAVDGKYQQPWGTFSLSLSYFKRYTQDVEDQTAAIAGLFGVPPIPTSIADQNNPRVQTYELRFASAFAGPLQLVAGYYFEHTNSSGVDFPPNIVPGFNVATGGVFGTDLLYTYAGRAVTIESAPYAEANYDLTQHWRATVGVRATHVEVISGPAYGDGIANGGPSTLPAVTLTETTTTPKFSLQYRFTPDDQAYATAAKGFRPGLASGGQVPESLCGSDAANLGISLINGQAGPVQPDTVWSYEAGEKTAWFDRRITANFDMFQINWNRVQTQVDLACGFPLTANAGTARSQGVELDVVARVIEGLTLELSGGYDDAKFTSTVPQALFQSGDRVPQVPRETAEFAANYDFHLGGRWNGFAHADYQYVGNSWSTNNSVTNPMTGRVVPLIRPDYQIANVRAGIRSANFEYAIFVKNLTNEIANLSDTNAISLQAPGQARVAVNVPRTVGVEFRYRH